MHKVEDLVSALGVDAGASKIEFSRVCAIFEDGTNALRSRPLPLLGYAHLLCHITYVRAKFAARVVLLAVEAATENVEGVGREVLCVIVGDLGNETY